MAAIEPQAILVWQRGDFRIVATRETEDGEPALVAETRFADALGKDSWRVFEVDSDDALYALGVLMQEVAIGIDLLPAWVRDFVKKQREEEETPERGDDVS